jgi:hypothetical protein
MDSNQRLTDANDRLSLDIRQMHTTIKLQLSIPPQVLLSKPVTLLDACGKVSAFHLDFINCIEAFVAVLKIRFEQEGVNQTGIKMLDQSEFILKDHRGTLELSQPWNRLLRPNQKVDMSMMFRRALPPSTCPACNYEYPSLSVQEIEW